MLFPIWWAIKWFVWEFMGLRAIWEKIHPPIAPSRKPATLGLWLLGGYIVLFLLVSMRYDNNVMIINARATALFNQINTVEDHETKRDIAFNQIPNIQNLRCPIEPRIWNPFHTILSLTGPPSFHQPTAEMLRLLLVDVIESDSDSLQSIVLNRSYIPLLNLYSADMRDADLSGSIMTGSSLIEVNLSNAKLNDVQLERASLVESDFTGAELTGANLSAADGGDANFSSAILRSVNLSESSMNDATFIGADLSGANLSQSDISGAVFIGADLTNADLTDADLTGAFFSGANLGGTKLDGADLSGADLNWSSNVTIEQLSRTRTLYEAEMEPFLKSQLLEQRPELFTEPDI